MHATIEFAKNMQRYYRPNQWDTFIRMARRKNPFTAVPLKYSDILDFKHVQNTKNAKIDSPGDIINWVKIRWLRVSKEDPDALFVKYDFDQDFLSVPLKGAKSRLSSTTINDKLI